MKKMNSVQGISILIAVLLFFIQSGFSQVNVSLPDTIATMGDTIKIPIVVDELPDSIFAYQFTLMYDSAKLSYLGVELDQTISEQWLPLMPLVNNKTPGSIMIGDYGLQPLNGRGTLLKIIFAVTGAHLDSSELYFDDFQFNSGDPAVILQNGKIKIFAPLITVSFRTNVIDSINITIDGLTKKLPFDTTWYKWTTHEISAPEEQIFRDDTRYLFDSWSDNGDTTHTVVANSDTIFQCNFLTYYLVTVNSDFGSPSGSGWYLEGDEATISVDSLISFGDTTRVLFKNWQGSFEGNEPVLSFTVTSPVVETAVWETQHFLNILSERGNPQGAGWYSEGDTVQFSVDSLDQISETERFVFDSWQGTGNGSYSGIAPLATVVMNNPITEIADWRHEFYLDIQSDPSFLIQFESGGWYASGDSLEIVAPENILWQGKKKYQFEQWLVDGNPAPENPLTVNFDSAHSVVAEYLLDSVMVRIAANISEAQLFVDSLKYPLPYEKFWKFESEHEIGVDSVISGQDSLSRYIFVEWLDGGNRFHKVKADSVLNISAEFKQQFYLNILTEPSGLWDFEEKGWYDELDTAFVTKAPDFILQNNDTLRFENWVVDSSAVSGNPIYVIMDSAHTAIAQYNYWLTISGAIHDKRGFPVAGVKISLTGDKIDSVMSDENGFYGIYQLSPGKYSIFPSIEWAVFEPNHIEVDLGTSSVTGQNFVAIDTVKPVVEIISPNGGEKFYVNTEDSIRWASSDNLGIDSLIFELTPDDGLHWQFLSILDVDFQDSTGVLIWQVPDSVTENARIRITAIDFDGNRFDDVSDGVFSIVRPSAVKREEPENLPVKFNLAQNYPNPFNSSTTISFSLPEADVVFADIYNFRGQLVVRLLERRMNPGNHKIRWNGCDANGKEVGSGIYFYQIRTRNGKSAVRKLLLLK